MTDGRTEAIAISFFCVFLKKSVGITIFSSKSQYPSDESTTCTIYDHRRPSDLCN